MNHLKIIGPIFNGQLLDPWRWSLRMGPTGCPETSVKKLPPLAA